MLLAISSVVLSTPMKAEPTRKERRTAQIGDTLQSAIVISDRPLTWIDIAVLENGADIDNAKTFARKTPTFRVIYRVVGVRGGKRYTVCGHNIGKLA